MSLKNINKWQLTLIICLCAICIVAFFVIAILILKNYQFDLDTYMINWSLNIRNAKLSNVIKVVTYLGTVYVLAGIVALLVIFVKNKKAKLFIAINFFVACGASVVLKWIVKRNRLVGVQIIEEVGTSFPSAHALLTMAVFGFLAYLVYKSIKNKYLKFIVPILIAVLPFVVSLTRIYLCVHFATDVIAGLLTGITIVGVTIIFYEAEYKFKSKKKKE